MGRGTEGAPLHPANSEVYLLRRTTRIVAATQL